MITAKGCERGGARFRTPRAAVAEEEKEEEGEEGEGAPPLRRSLRLRQNLKGK